MPIRGTCDSCGAAFRVPDERAGQRRRCPRCRALVDVPGRNPVSPPDADEAGSKSLGPVSLKDILEAFHGDIEPVRRTLVYRISVVILAGVLLMLPVAYLALIAGVGWLLVYHVTHTIDAIARTHSIWALLFGYVGPIVVGAILLFFMVKPLFAPRRRSGRLRTLEFGEEPLLFALVTRVARAAGAPEPKRIDVDARANASAGFGGFLGVLFGRDLVLTIGLPLVAGLTVQQFAGVVAHELGHFSQGAAMRLSYVVRAINAWFARLVYERDDWDEALAEGVQRGDRLSAVLLVAMLCVWFTRWVLWLLMAIGHGLSCLLSRQMEYDADRFMTRLVGTAAFVETSRRLLLLDYGAAFAQTVTVHAWLSGRGLPDDLAELIVGVASAVPRDKALEVDWKMQQAKTGLFDTHPAHGDRVRAARREKAPGVFHLDGPAAELFGNFAKTSRAATMDFYRVAFGRSVRRNELVPATTFLSGGDGAADA